MHMHFVYEYFSNIGDYFGLHYFLLGRIINQLEAFKAST
jgi:hypothetical protein